MTQQPTRSPKRAPSRKRSTPKTLNAAAVRAFESLDPSRQACLLDVLATLASPRIAPSRLRGTTAQREAARKRDAEIKAKIAKTEAKQLERMEIASKLATLHNRAQLRKGRRPYPHADLTPAETRQYDKLQARLNEIDGIGKGGVL